MWLKASKKHGRGVDCRVFLDSQSVKLMQAGSWIVMSFDEWDEANDRVWERRSE